MKTEDEAIDGMFINGHCGHCGATTKGQVDKCFNCGYDIPNIVVSKQALLAYIKSKVVVARERHFQAIIPDEGPDESTKGTFADGYAQAIKDVCDAHYNVFKAQENKDA